MMNHKLIAACYLFIGGLLLAILLPFPRIAPPMGFLFLLLLAGTFSGMLYFARRSGSALRRIMLWYFVVVASILLGYWRYSIADSVSDQQIGRIQKGMYVAHTALHDTSRIMLRLDQSPTEDVVLRVHGELRARQVIRNDAGKPLLDAGGRWVFRERVMPIESDPVRIPAHTPAGSFFPVEQPYNRIDGIHWESEDTNVPFTVYRVSNHIGSFVRGARAQSPVTVLGRVAQDPHVFDYRSVLRVTPAYIQFPAGGPFYRLEGGDIQVTVMPTLANYAGFSQSSAYGADIVIEGELTVARGASIEGGFDARRFMQNHNVFGVMHASARPSDASPVTLVAPYGQARRTGNAIVAFSLRLRDRMLAIFKATMPHPHSAFLGGVTLGLRYGLQGVMFPVDGAGWIQRLAGGPSESFIVQDFRASGVNHVLAVSGLHVTILTVMFVAIFTLAKFPRQVFVPIVIAVLVVFAIITGARPSTLRAVIMNSLFLLTWGYLDKGLRSSVLTGVPIAAAMILVHNPLVVVDPSFTLSFGAILSLALLTGPIYQQLARLRGNLFIAVVMATALTTALVAVRWALVSRVVFWGPWAVVWSSIFWMARRWDRQDVGISPKICFARLPESIGTFVAAQIAIQIGMMIPLSAYYFSQWPFGGMYANLIAIPLIGVVVQLGVLAGLLGLLPVVGPLLALILNAANWLATSVFLVVAFFFARVFPHPFVPRPSGVALLLYYAILVLLVWPDSVQKYGRRIWQWCGMQGALPKRAIPYGLAACCVCSIFVVNRIGGAARGAGVLDVTVLPVGYGSAILVRSPGGAHYLIDTGFVEYERGRRNEALRTIMPTFSHRRIGQLDGVIMTSALPERAGGLPYILAHQRMNRLILPFSLDTVGDHSIPAGDDMLIDMAQAIWFGHAQWLARPAVHTQLLRREATALNCWAGWSIQPEAVQSPSVLVEEKHPNGDFRIEVLAVQGAPQFWKQRSLQLRISYGDFRMLLPGAIGYEAQRDFVASMDPEMLRANVLVAPGQAAARFPGTVQGDVLRMRRLLGESTGALMSAAQPDAVILEFGNPRPALGRDSRDALDRYAVTRRFYEDHDVTVWGTDRDLAIYIMSDGKTFHIESQAQRNFLQGGVEDAVTDLSVGL